MGNKRKNLFKTFTGKRRKVTSSSERFKPSSEFLTELLPVGPETSTSIGTSANQNNQHDNDISDAVRTHNVDMEITNTIHKEIEPELEETNNSVNGRRLIDIAYFFNQLKHIASHESLCRCGLESVSLINEKRTGLVSKFKLRCNMCLGTFYVDSEEPVPTDNVDVNFAAVAGVISSGIGYSQFEELTASMNIPIFSKKYFLKIQDKVFNKWEETSVEEMEAAAERERQAAIAEGKVKDGIAFIDVYADGCWSSRSYGNNYKALSGAAAIIGRKFGEVLFMAVRNKYCIICARYEKKGIPTKTHVCYKNYEGPSTGMESEIISEGFRQSIDMYNIIYKRLIADGDSATYSKILVQNPYPNTTVTKIECRNHILRNLCNKLRALSKDVKYPIKFRKLLSNITIMVIRKVIADSIKQQKKIEDTNKRIENLHKDIINSINHAFGDHRLCKEYYCKKDKSMESAMEQSNTTFWFRLRAIIGSVASKLQSLAEDVNTNTVERFNSIVAKTVGGKRINFSFRRSYQGRCAAAVVLFNNKLPRYTLQKKYLGRNPKTCLKKMEEKRIRQKAWNRKNPVKKNRIRGNRGQSEYGSNSTAPDMTIDVYNKAKDEFLENLNNLTNDKQKIQKDTIMQRDCNNWIEIRKNMVTASNFGKILKRRKNKSCANLVKNILYAENISHVSSIAHGIDNEKIALQQLAKQLDIRINPCGLFIDNKYPFIGATPDGLVGDDTIVEVKCPIVTLKEGIDAAIEANKVQMYSFDKRKGTYHINVKSNWYYQVQGQLHISERKICIFAIWSGENRPLKVEYIERDDVFWDTIENELVNFYLNCILPEIVDPRRNRGMPIRDGVQPTKPQTPKQVTNEPSKLNSPAKKEKPTRQVLAPVQTNTRTLDFSEF